MSKSRKFTQTRWKIVTFSEARADCYHSRTFDTREDGIGYIRGWTKEDDAKYGYKGKGIVRTKQYEGNPYTVAVVRDGLIVGVVSPLFERVSVNYGD